MTRTGRLVLALLAAWAIAVIGTTAAQAQTYTVLHVFKGPDGALPNGGLISDADGNLYGTTYAGGPSDYGVIFRLNKTGEKVLYSFTGGTDGGTPTAPLTLDSAGNLYGTTFGGGINNCAPVPGPQRPSAIPRGPAASGNGCGVVFKLDTRGRETVLYTFIGLTDGALPNAGLFRDLAGNLYGTTTSGGYFIDFVKGFGVVFKVDTTGKETVLHEFGMVPGDGLLPDGGVIRDPAGGFLGTTYGGGLAAGTLFKLNSAGETVVYNFGLTTDVYGPSGDLIRDAAGNLYGTAAYGGASNYGGIFRLDKSGHETVLYSFTGGTDGAHPYGGLVRDPAGNLYGTTSEGGLNTCLGGCGVIFKLDTAGKETVLHSFTGTADGASPGSPLIRDAAGNLYGTAAVGGELNDGVVFRLKP